MRHHTAKKHNRYSLFLPAILLVVVTLVLAVLIKNPQNLVSRALSIVHFEAESGTKSGSSAVVTDTSASGGQAIVLNVPTDDPSVPLPAATNITYTCGAGGTTVTFRWSAVTGAANYQLRLDYHPDSWAPGTGPGKDVNDQMPSLLSATTWTATILPNNEYWMTIQAVRATDTYPYPGQYGGTGRFTCAGAPTTIPTATTAPTPTTAPNTVNIPVTVTVTNPSADWDISIHQWSTLGNGTPVECARVRADKATITATCYNLARADGFNNYAVGAVGIRRSDAMRSVPDEDFIRVPLTGDPVPTSASVQITLGVPTVLVRGDISSTTSEISRGQNYTYTISAFDEYNLVEQTVTIVDQIDPRILIRNASISRGSCQITGQQVRCTAPIKYNRPITVNIGVTMSPTASPLGALIGNSATISVGNYTHTTRSTVVRVNP